MNMKNCPICFNIFAETRKHCPACGAIDMSYLPGFKKDAIASVDLSHQLVVAYGAERARQLPQSPRMFLLVD